jgi:hypothetical protein
MVFRVDKKRQRNHASFSRAAQRGEMGSRRGIQMITKLIWVLLLLSAASVAVEPGGARTYWYKGNQIDVLTLDGGTVQGSLLTSGRYNRVDLRVFNRGTRTVRIQPESVALTAVADKDIEMETLSEREVQKSVSEQLLVGSVLNGFVPSASQSAANKVSWMPDAASRWEPYRVPPSPAEAAAARRRQINELLLRDTTVLPNESLTGSVFFKGAGKFEGALVTIGLGSRLFKLAFGEGAPPVAMAALEANSIAATLPQSDLAPVEANPNPLFYELGIEVKPSRFEGLEITGITAYSPAAKAGLRATDDTILSVNGVPVKTVDDINRVLSGQQLSKVTMTVMHQYWQEEKVITLH